ncbi:hypothetical protein BZA05DRAFT_38059 [Tricharina praecox]|uniref:uncharacterized protein n=1 Tax=Tricharina praecox TaxID=43433 RepID=UPI00221ED326|nr:uncharacterized protein BZA05DRAFT_38059 [Tricharina praecox]KAI5852181.1 hypothetical protein BZA05DRAFT_38059 [Tricharina praecox]
MFLLFLGAMMLDDGLGALCAAFRPRVSLRSLVVVRAPQVPGYARFASAGAGLSRILSTSDDHITTRWLVRNTQLTTIRIAILRHNSQHLLQLYSARSARPCTHSPALHSLPDRAGTERSHCLSFQRTCSCRRRR